MRSLLRRIWYIASGRRQEIDLADELAFHRDMKVQELRDRGLSESEVAAATQRELGNDLSARQARSRRLTTETGATPPNRSRVSPPTRAAP